MDRTEWELEVCYIERTAQTRSFTPCFNEDPACFARYVAMQASVARKQGFADIGDRIGAIPLPMHACDRCRDTGTTTDPDNCGATTYCACNAGTRAIRRDRAIASGRIALAS